MLATASLLATAAATAAPTPPAPSPALQISEPAALLSHEQMITWKVAWPDAGLYSIKNAQGRQFFMEGGPAGDDPGTPWSVFSSPPGDGMAVQDLVATNLAVEGFTCPNGFEEPCVHLDPDPGGIMLNKCDPSSLTQQWNTSAGDPSVVTTVQSVASGSCWEVNGCGGARQNAFLGATFISHRSFTKTGSGQT
jgi:hypothetical protein